MAQLSAGYSLRASAANELGLKLVRRGSRNTNKTGITTEVGLIGLYNIPMKASRAYFLEYRFKCTNVAASLTVRNRVTTDGSTPTTGGASITPSFHLANATFGNTFTGRTLYVPSVDVSFNWWLTLQSTATIATDRADNDTPIEVWVWDGGDDPGDTGVDV